MTEEVEYKCFKCKWQYDLHSGTNCVLCRANSNFTPIFGEKKRRMINK